MKKYLIFDLDGTLIQSITDLTNFIAQYLLYNYEIDPEETNYHLKMSQGVPLRQQLMKLMKIEEEEAKEISNEIYKLLDKNVHGNFFLGVPKKIAELSKYYTLFLSTGNSSFFAKNHLNQADILECFEYVLGSENILKGNEHIEIFKKISGDKEFEKHAVFIGDGVKDREIAKKNHIDFIHIDPKGENKFGDKYEIEYVTQIDEILKQL